MSPCHNPLKDGVFFSPVILVIYFFGDIWALRNPKYLAKNKFKCGRFQRRSR